MHLLRDSLLILTASALLGGAVYQYRYSRDEKQKVTEAREAVRRIKREIDIQMALEEVEPAQRGYPATIDPVWFGALPRNPLFPDNRPWLEVAGEHDRDALHPHDCVASQGDTATFWYNPSNGVVRARVPAGVSDARTLELYNYVNDCRLRDLFRRDRYDDEPGEDAE